MSMTAADLATVRRRIGDTAASPYLSDAVLNAIYDSSSLGASSLNYTTYHALTELLGMLSPLVDKSNEVDSMSISASQYFDHIMDKLLPLWGTITGLTAVYESYGVAEGGIAAPCGVLVDCDDPPCT